METLTTRNSILGAFRRRVRRVDIDDLGTIIIRPLSGSQRATLADTYKAAAGNSQVELTRNVQAQVIAWALVDENGERLFGDGDVEQIAEQFDAPAMDAISLEVLRASGLTPGAQGDVEKNSVSGQRASSPTDSPASSAMPTSIDFSMSSTRIS